MKEAFLGGVIRGMMTAFGLIAVLSVITLLLIEGGALAWLGVGFGWSAMAIGALAYRERTERRRLFAVRELVKGAYRSGLDSIKLDSLETVMNDKEVALARKLAHQAREQVWSERYNRREASDY